MYCIEYGYIKRICFYYPAWCCADLSEQECFSVLGRQIYTGHFPLSPYMPLLYTYSKPMCVYNIGVCIAVVLWLDFLFMPCIMGRKCTASISCPWRGGGGRQRGLGGKTNTMEDMDAGTSAGPHISESQKGQSQEMAPSVALHLFSILFLFSDAPSSPCAMLL